MAVETETIRNVCLIGHRGSGKTSIAEGMIGLASGRSGPTSGVLECQFGVQTAGFPRVLVESSR